MFISYEKEADVKGIATWRFGFDIRNYRSAELEPRNECFCRHAHKKRPHVNHN